MDFHGRMVNIQTSRLAEGLKEATELAEQRKGDEKEYAYKLGHRDARHAAAEIAMEADREIERLQNRVAELERDLQAEWEHQAGASL